MLGRHAGSVAQVTVQRLLEGHDRHPMTGIQCSGGNVREGNGGEGGFRILTQVSVWNQFLKA